MLHLNIAGQGRPGGRTPAAVLEGGITDRWLTYHSGSGELALVQEAIRLIRTRTLDDPAVRGTCDARLQRMAGVDFSALIEGPRAIVISRNPELHNEYYGVTSGNHISIAQYCFTRTPRATAVATTAATLVHELAHVAMGARAQGDYQAESAVRACGFSGQFVPGPVGRFSIPRLAQMFMV